MAGIFNKTEGIVRNLTPNQDTANFNGEVLLSTEIDILDQDGYEIGFISQINPSASRATERIRMLGSADSGRVIEQAPRPEDLTLSVSGFALKNNVNEKGTLVQRLGAWNPLQAMSSLSEQHIGFKIIVVERDPVTKKAMDAREYDDCWLQSFNRPYNISGATITDSANIIASRVFRPSNWQSL